jgi:transposase
MSRVDRNNPKRSKASESTYSLMKFMEQFPDDAACLEFLVEKLYPEGIYCPKCERVTKHHREKNRPSYACQYCGHHEHPLVGTIFENSATSLKLWFYAIYLMASTRCGISAKQLERELGVTYKTAWRMFHKIRSLLDQGDPLFAGTVEADEAYVGGAAKWRNRGIPENKGRGPVDKTPVFGMARRGEGNRSGQIVAKVVDDAGAKSILPHVRTKVLPESVVYTDEAAIYQKLPDMGYQHGWVSHSNKVYVSGDVHTNTIDGFWTHLKRGVSGVYRGVSPRHLQSYLDEYVFRYNNRDDVRGMFTAIFDRVEKASPESPSEQPS